jgi:hypothetical protein
MHTHIFFIIIIIIYNTIHIHTHIYSLSFIQTRRFLERTPGARASEGEGNNVGDAFNSADTRKK